MRMRATLASTFVVRIYANSRPIGGILLVLTKLDDFGWVCEAKFESFSFDILTVITFVDTGAIHASVADQKNYVMIFQIVVAFPMIFVVNF